MTDVIGAGIKNSIELFDEAVSRTSNLEIVCADVVDGKDVLVVENSNIDSKVEGHQCTVDVNELFAVIKDCHSAQQFIDVINMDRKPVVCEGITRIVGYYSRTHNWNKSKIGELRDRQKGQYGTGNHQAKYHEDAMKHVNALS
jgi:hypothetical protein